MRLALLLLLAASASAQEMPRWTHPVSAAVAVSGSVADAITTRQNMRAGYIELNPLVGSHVSDGELAIRVGVVVAGVALQYVALRVMPEEQRPKWRRRFTLVNGVAGGAAWGAATWNVAIR